jgi:hypothetical protein
LSKVTVGMLLLSFTGRNVPDDPSKGGWCAGRGLRPAGGDLHESPCLPAGATR